mgnify:CR=1 FL=1
METKSPHNSGGGTAVELLLSVAQGGVPISTATISRPAAISARVRLAERLQSVTPDRVQQRLDVLAAQTADFDTTSPVARREAAGPWSIYGGISQDYWLDSFETDGDDSADSRTNLITFVNLGADYRGQRFDMSSRLDAGYQNNLSNSDRSTADTGNDLLVSNAYIQLADQKLGLQGALGRQTLYTDGVLGRFDGLRATYAWRDNIRFHSTLGLAVDSPRFQGDTRRPFAGISAHIDDVLDQFDVQLFAIVRTNEGASDREAIGTQISWRRDRWQVAGNLALSMLHVSGLPQTWPFWRSRWNRSLITDELPGSRRRNIDVDATFLNSFPTIG